MISYRRFKEFIKVAFGDDVRLPQYVAILKAAIKIAVKRVGRRKWFSRMMICYRCPIFNSYSKRCRPFDGSVLGCGCYTPYKALLEDECWGRKRFGERIGWK